MVGWKWDGALGCCLCLAACSVGAELESADQYSPSVTTPVLRAPGDSGLSDAGTTASSGTVAFSGCDVNAAMVSCQGPACHGRPGAESAVTLSAGLDLFSTTRETDLLDRPATYEGVPEEDLPNCPSPPELLVDTENVDRSLILTKLDDTHACGLAMPIGSPIANEDAQCIRDWLHFLTDQNR